MQAKKIFMPLLAGLLSFGSTSGAIAQEMLRTITVTGQGKKSVPTSISTVRLGVEVRGKTAADVQADIAQRSSQLVDFLKSEAVDELTTTGIRLQPQYKYRDGDRRLTGYTATNAVSFDIPTAEAGSIMDEAVEEGATRIDGISFRATDDVLAEAEQVALTKAAKDAQTQADAVLAALGLSAKEIIQIQVNNARVPEPFLPYEPIIERASFDEAASTPVEGGDQTVNASVTLSIRY